ncbi:hypothetical protein Droror1_Dr00001180 [Drosera rotundifolia]
MVFCRLPSRDRLQGTSNVRSILHDSLWENSTRWTSLFEPLVKVLCMIDSDDKAQMGYIYEAMDRAKKAIKHNLPKGYNKYSKIINRRWTKTLHHDLHVAGK